MKRKLADRVAALEHRSAHFSTAGPTVPLWLLTLIALELGDLQSHEAVAEGYARALGYTDLRSLRAGMSTGDVGERHRTAVLTMVHHVGYDGGDPMPYLQALIERHAGELQTRLVA